MRPEDGICEAPSLGTCVIGMSRGHEYGSCIQRFFSLMQTYQLEYLDITNMERMFSGNEGFNQDISSWDVSGVGSMDDVL